MCDVIAGWPPNSQIKKETAERDYAKDYVNTTTNNIGPITSLLICITIERISYPKEKSKWMKSTLMALN